MTIFRNKWFRLGALLFLIALLFFFCGRRAKEVTAVEARLGDISTTVSANGSVQSDVTVKLGTKAVGDIEKMYIDEGSLIKKGSTVAVLDTYDQANRDYLRIKKLYAQGAASRQQLEQAEITMENSIIISPISGTVTQKLAEEGETVSPGTPIAVVADLNKLVLECDVDESDIGGMKTGMPGKITFDAYPNQSFEGKVTEIARQTTEEKEAGVTFQIKISLDRVNVPLRIGMSADVDILSASKQNTLVVPFESIREQDSARFVYTIGENGRVAKVKVTTGLEGDDAIEILSGIQAGTTVITGDLTNIKEGMRVRPVGDDKNPRKQDNSAAPSSNKSIPDQ